MHMCSKWLFLCLLCWSIIFCFVGVILDCLHGILSRRNSRWARTASIHNQLKKMRKGHLMLWETVPASVITPSGPDSVGNGIWEPRVRPCLQSGKWDSQVEASLRETYIWLEEIYPETRKIFNFHSCVCVMYVWISGETWRGHRSLGAGVTGSCEPLWVLGTKLMSSAGAVCAHNLGPPSDPDFPILKLNKRHIN